MSRTRQRARWDDTFKESPSSSPQRYPRCMKDDIVGKLERHLQKPLDDESWVVYLLAEVRKLREKVEWSPATPALRMCCHWSLHVDLDHPSTVSDFFEPIERWITHTVAGLTPLGSWRSEERRVG